jgi:simple sugar transport system substrate-binding protein
MKSRILVAICSFFLAVSLSAKTITIGFAQTGSESVWRVANSNSMKTEAEKRGIKLLFVDSESKIEKQRAAVKSFIEQKVDAIILAPLVVDGWENLLKDAKAAGIPIVIMDRKVFVTDDGLFATFIGSDFYKEGTMAAEWLIANAGSHRAIVELLGEQGSAAANERHRAFASMMALHAASEGYRIIDKQVANFRRDEGKKVMIDMLQKNAGKIEIVYAHNDDMALGAIEAIKEAGLKPGRDILVVSVDATKGAIEAVAAGEMNCTVECNPLFGPKVYDVVARILKGETVQKEMYNKDDVFDAKNAAAALPSRKY